MYFDYDTIVTFCGVNVWVLKNHIKKIIISGDHLIHPKYNICEKNYKHSQNSWCASGLHHFSSSFNYFEIFLQSPPNFHAILKWFRKPLFSISCDIYDDASLINELTITNYDNDESS
jgi:hypothetical protein